MSITYKNGVTIISHKAFPSFQDESPLVTGMGLAGEIRNERASDHDSQFENNWENVDENLFEMQESELEHTKNNVQGSTEQALWHQDAEGHDLEQSNSNVFDEKRIEKLAKSSVMVSKTNASRSMTLHSEHDLYSENEKCDLETFPSESRQHLYEDKTIGTELEITRPEDISDGTSLRLISTFHAQVRADGSNDGGSVGCCGYILWALSLIAIGLTFPFSLCLCIKVVQEYERAVIFRLGRLVAGGAKGPGLFFIIPCIDSYTKVDLRTVSFDVPPQEVLTKDSVTVAVDAVVYYRVQNATMSITNVEDSNRSTRLLAATTLRNVLGTKNLSEILSERESISHVMQGNLDECTDPWGIRVERVEIKDVRLPVQLQRAMAAEAEAAREARAKVIAAEGEQKASRALKEAADVIVESPAALQLRYLQTLNTISAEKNSTIIFPLPIDLLQSFMHRGSKM